MRLGIDASNLRLGGGITHLQALLRHGEPRGCGYSEVVVWCSRDTAARLGRPAWLKVVHEPLLDQRLPMRLYWQRRILPRRARRSCDALFAPGGLCTNRFRPVVTMSRNSLPFERDELRSYRLSRERLKLTLVRGAQINSFRCADGVIFLSDYARRLVLAQTGPLAGATALIPHGVDTRFRRDGRRPKVRSQADASNPFRLLYVSHLDVYKHQWSVVEAAARLRQRGYAVELTLIGPDRVRAARHRLEKAIAACDPQGRFVRWRGGVDHAELHRAYGEADLFVYASSCENLPNILLEAMASGLPIASSRSGPMPEVLGRCGRYFDPRKPEQIADVVGRLLDDAGERERLAASAARRAERFCWRNCAQRTFEFLAEVAQGRSNVTEPGERQLAFSSGLDLVGSAGE